MIWEEDDIISIKPKPKKYRRPKMDTRVNLTHSEAVESGETCICLDDPVGWSAVLVEDEVISLGKLLGFEKCMFEGEVHYAPIYEATRGN